jgi:uncharacterized protein HemX
LLQRDETGFRADIATAREWTNRYFSRQDEASKAFIASLETLLHAPVALKDAQISASMQAVRMARGAH